eukprot:IDg20128t1
MMTSHLWVLSSSYRLLWSSSFFLSCCSGAFCFCGNLAILCCRALKPDGSGLDSCLTSTTWFLSCFLLEIIVLAEFEVLVSSVCSVSAMRGLTTLTSLVRFKSGDQNVVQNRCGRGCNGGRATGSACDCMKHTTKGKDWGTWGFREGNARRIAEKPELGITRTQSFTESAAVALISKRT